jgi:hypothetical protein
MELKEQTVRFKSKLENFNKELLGIKCNTFRKENIRDPRFNQLFNMWSNKELGIIEINCENSCFKRRIKDITYWDGYVIISWDNPDVIKNEIAFLKKILDETCCDQEDFIDGNECSKCKMINNRINDLQKNDV